MERVDTERVAATYMLRGIQNWGQSQKERDQAEREYVEAAGFRPGSKDAQIWLRAIMLNFRWGDVNDEIAQLKAALDARI